MSKYDPLWKYIHGEGRPELLLSFAEIESILGFGIDHAFLNFKKELAGYGYEAAKISLKRQTILFKRLAP